MARSEPVPNHLMDDAMARAEAEGRPPLSLAFDAIRDLFWSWLTPPQTLVTQGKRGTKGATMTPTTEVAGRCANSPGRGPNPKEVPS